MGIQMAMRKLCPDRVHCSNRLYESLLSGLGIPARLLPLFSNISVSVVDSDPYEEVARNYEPSSSRSDWTVVSLFGSIYPANNLPKALHWLQRRCSNLQKRLLVVSLGHCPIASATFESLASSFPASNRPVFLVKGRIEAAELSRWIRSADCAISTTPYNIIEKSGSAIAFAEHGVPVIVMDAGAEVRGIEQTNTDHTPEFWLLGDRFLESLDGLPPRRVPSSRLDFVARQFLDDLASSKPDLCQPIHPIAS
jgi:glycosyltransferase involved in cell wall biosynthesis